MVRLDGSSVAESGGLVQVWYDQAFTVGNENATQQDFGVESTQIDNMPMLTSHAFATDTMNVLDFDRGTTTKSSSPTSDYLSSKLGGQARTATFGDGFTPGADSAYDTVSDGLSWFIVFKDDIVTSSGSGGSSTGRQTLFRTISTNYTTDLWGSATQDTGNDPDTDQVEMFSQVRTSSGAVNHISANITSQWYIIGSSWDPVTGAFTTVMYDETGSQVGSFSSNTATNSDTATHVLSRIGLLPSATVPPGSNSSSYAFDGQMAEILVYDTALDSAGMTAVTDYLNEKYFLPTDYTWLNAAGGNWSLGTNWSAGIAPNGAGRIAKFTNAINPGATVSLDAPATMGKLLFDNASSYQIVGASTLTLSPGGLGTNQIEVVSGNHEISVPITMDAETVVTTASGTTLTLSGAVGGLGGLTKSGDGSVLLTQANGYFGNTTISGGTLALGTSGTIASSPLIDVQADSFFDVTAKSGGLILSSSQILKGIGTVKGTLITSNGSVITPGASPGTLTIEGNLNLAGGDILQYDISNTPTNCDKILINKLSGSGGNLTLGGNTTLAFTMAEPLLLSGSYELIHYAGALSGTPNFTLLGLSTPAGARPQGFSVSTATAQHVNLVVTGGPKGLAWRGDGSSNAWDVEYTANWNDNADVFYYLDSVTFDDDLDENSTTVDIQAYVAPASILVNNDTENYTFTGYGGITGQTGITKEGAGKLTIENSGFNDFTGEITINGGTVAFNHDFNTDVTQNVTGAGTLRQEGGAYGTSVLTLSGDNSGFTGPIIVAVGTLKAGNSSAMGDAVGDTTIEDGATLDVNGVNLGDELVKVQGTGVGGLGAIVNNGADNGGYTLKYIELTGPVTFGGPKRWDIRLGTLTTHGYKITKIGTQMLAIAQCNVDDVADIDIQEGALRWVCDTMGVTSNKVTIASGGELNFHLDGIVVDKIIESDGGIISNTAGGSTLVGPITLNNDTTFKVYYGSMTVEGPITGNGGIIKTDHERPLTLTSDANDYLGITTIMGGTLSVGNGGATGTLGQGDVILQAGAANVATLLYNRAAAFTPANVITGEGVVVYDNPDAVVTLAHANTYAGLTQINNGIVILKHADGLGSGLGIPGQTEITNSTGRSQTGRLQLDPGAAGSLTINDGFLLSGSSYGPFAYTGPGLIENVTGNNTIAGNIEVTSGGGSSLITVSGGSLTLDGTVSNISTRRTMAFGGAGNGTVNGAITDGSHTLDVFKLGTGTWTLTNANSYTGYTAIHAGTLALAKNPSTLSEGNIDTSPLLTLQSFTATLHLDSSLTNPTLVMYDGSTNPVIPGVESIVGIGTIAGNLTTGYNSVLSPSGPVTKNVAGNDIYTNLPGGTLTIQGNLNSPYGFGGESLIFKLTSDTVHNDRISVSNNVTLDGSSLTKVLIVPGGPLAVGGSYTLLSATSIINGGYGGGFVLDPNHNTRYSMTLATNPASLVLTVNSGFDKKILTWTGGTSSIWNSVAWDGMGYSGGQQNWQDAIPDDEVFYQGDAVIFDDNYVGASDDVTLQGTLYPASITVDADRSYNFIGDGRLSSGTGIAKSGDGTLTIANTGENDFLGTVTITGGTLKVGTSTALGSRLVGTEINSGTLDINGQGVGKEPIGVQNNGAIVNTGGETTLYDVTLTGPATFGGETDWSVSGLVPSYGWQAGRLVGGGNTLTKAGDNEVTLSDLGPTGLGDINITAGTLTVSGSTNLGSSTITLSGGGVLKLDDLDDPVAKSLDVAATGGVIDNASGDNVIAGIDGTLDGLLTAQTAEETILTLGNALDGTGGLTKEEDGRLVLSGANSYSGATTVSEGVLELVTGGQIGVASLIANEAELEVTSGSHTVGVVTGDGTTTVLGTASLTAVSITQGTLFIGSGGGGGAAAAGITPVPEPGTWLLLLMGLLGIAGWRTLRNRR
ncbi:MAG: autotransporter-associated beta strand repeat-containing protein [Pirellulales bacterium]|nr:autotransporter-associated beta strand repeat-containing protein [Pirellulales bacterium]